MTMPSKAHVIDDHHLTFDSGDKRNGSLYIGTPLTGPAPLDLQVLLAALREAGLWSEVEPKQVADNQRQAYKDQLQLVDAKRYQTAQGSFMISRFDHPKFPSDEGRWIEWENFFDSRYKRAD